MHELLRRGMDLAGRMAFLDRIQPNSEVEKRNRLARECQRLLDKDDFGEAFGRKDFEKFIDNMIFLIGSAGYVAGMAIFPVKTLDEDGEDISLMFRKRDLSGNKHYSISANVMRGDGKGVDSFTEEVWYGKQDTIKRSKQEILARYSASIPFIRSTNSNEENSVIYNSFLINCPMEALLDANTGKYQRTIEDFGDGGAQLICSGVFEVIVSKNRVDFPRL